MVRDQARRILRATALHRKGPFRAGSTRHDPLPIRALDTVAVLYFLVPILDRSKYRVGLLIGYTLLILNLWWHLNGHGDFRLLRHGSLPQQGVDFILKHSRSLIHWFWAAIFKSNDYFGRLCFSISIKSFKDIFALQSAHSQIFCPSRQLFFRFNRSLPIDK